MKRFVLLLGLLSIATSAGCSKATWNRDWDYSPQTVTVFNADGSVRKVYQATGKVYSERSSDGWFFTDAATGKLTCITGFVEIVQSDKRPGLR